MIHQESNQLLMGHYLIDDKENIRVIPIEKMPGRLTAIARHLSRPDSLVYYYDMEGSLYETNIYTLSVIKLFEDPLPGWHGKGGYTSQQKLVLANNGESSSLEKSDFWQVKDIPLGDSNIGVLATYDGSQWEIIERKQYTDVTTRNGIKAIPNENSPLWSIGWDDKSLRLKVMENNAWSTFLLPKATYNNDPAHGWFTEWPRIRSIGKDRMMMDMHGMFFEFPPTFSGNMSAGIRPISSHLRYVPDFLEWNGQLVLATDETSIQGNPLAGQPQSNLWFGKVEDIENWGPATGYGAIWLEEEVPENTPSLPYLFNGFDQRVLHLVNHSEHLVQVNLELDINGQDVWTPFKHIKVPGNTYEHLTISDSIQAEWIRLNSSNKAQLSAVFHYTQNRYSDKSEKTGLFNGIATADYPGDVLHATLYTNQSNFHLSVFNESWNGTILEFKKEFEFNKYDFEFAPGINDSTAIRAKEKENFWAVDKASVILKTSTENLRLPKGNQALDHTSGQFRSMREVESERILANIHGTFYEVPLFKINEEPLYAMMRPVTTHNLQISDYNSWNGLLVIAGIQRDAVPSTHIYRDSNNEAALWFGGIDDIWSMGKPIGEGGPWYQTSIKADIPSDKYLMTGYDRKTMILETDQNVSIEVYLFINHYLDEPVLYRSFEIKKDKPTIHKFPQGFSAHWVQLIADKDCVATARFVYE